MYLKQNHYLYQMKKLIIISMLIFSISQVFGQVEKPQKENKQILSFGFGANYYFTPKNGTYVPRRPACRETMLSAVYVGLEIETFVGSYLECNYYYKFKNNFIVGGGINYLRKKKRYLYDEDSVAMYKPLPNHAYFLERTFSSNLLQLKIEAGYSIKRFSFFIGSSYDAIEWGKEVSNMDDGTTTTNHGSSFFDIDTPCSIIAPLNVSVQYLLIDKKIRTNIYARYVSVNNMLMAGFRFDLNLKHDEK